MPLRLDIGYVFKIIQRISGAVPYTLLIIVLSGCLGLVLAMGVASIRVKKWRIVYPLTSLYVSFFRSTPCIIHIFIVYYAMPMLLRGFGLNIDDWSKTVYVLLALVLYNGAHMSEFLRPAYLAVDKGQHDAADSIGMTGWAKFTRIILPQMLPVAWPNIENAMVELVKDTSVLFVIGLTDIMGRAKTIIVNDYGVKKLEVYLAAGVIYWCVTFALSKLFQVAEKRIDYKSPGRKRVVS